MYSPTDQTIWVVSSQYSDTPDLRLQTKIYNLDMNQKFPRTITLDSDADSTQRVFALHKLQGPSSVSFLKLFEAKGWNEDSPSRNACKLLI